MLTRLLHSSLHLALKIPMRRILFIPVLETQGYKMSKTESNLPKVALPENIRSRTHSFNSNSIFYAFYLFRILLRTPQLIWLLFTLWKSMCFSYSCYIFQCTGKFLCMFVFQVWSYVATSVKISSGVFWPPLAGTAAVPHGKYHVTQLHNWKVLTNPAREFISVQRGTRAVNTPSPYITRGQSKPICYISSEDPFAMDTC